MAAVIHWFCGPMVSRGFQWLIGSCGQTVVFSGRSNSLAPVAQVVLWFPAPVVNGRGNSLVLWLHGVPWFPVAHWFLCSDCGAVQWLKCAVCGPVLHGSFNPLQLCDAWNGSRQCTGFFCCAYFVQNGQSGPNPFLVQQAHPIPRVPWNHQPRGSNAVVQNSTPTSGGLGKYAEMADRPPMESSLAALWFVGA